MVSRRVLLEVAAFLDSSAAGALDAPAREDVRRIAERFVAVCYDELGKKPALLDGHDVELALVEHLPARFGADDPLAPEVAPVLAALFDHLEESQVVTQVFEIRRALASTGPAFLEAVRSGHLAGLHQEPQRPIVHGAPKLGRNDPCSCGSGKKYKKCHGRGA